MRCLEFTAQARERLTMSNPNKLTDEQIAARPREIPYIGTPFYTISYPGGDWIAADGLESSSWLRTCCLYPGEPGCPWPPPLEYRGIGLGATVIARTTCGYRPWSGVTPGANYVFLMKVATGLTMPIRPPCTSHQILNKSRPALIGRLIKPFLAPIGPIPDRIFTC